MVKTLKTRDMSALKEKLKKQAGFTLAELLIVVAIMAILAAIAVPVYIGQMDAAKKRVDEGTLSSATTMAAADYLLNNRTGDCEYFVCQSTATAQGNRNIAVYTASGIENATSKPTGFGDYAYQYTPYAGTIKIVITTGGVIKTSSIGTTGTPGGGGG